MDHNHFALMSSQGAESADPVAQAQADYTRLQLGADASGRRLYKQLTSQDDRGLPRGELYCGELIRLARQSPAFGGLAKNYSHDEAVRLAVLDENAMTQADHSASSPDSSAVQAVRTAGSNANLGPEALSTDTALGAEVVRDLSQKTGALDQAAHAAQDGYSGAGAGFGRALAAAEANQVLDARQVVAKADADRTNAKNSGWAAAEQNNELASQQVIDRARTEYAKAKMTVDALDQRLLVELADLGPALNMEERRAYIDKFHQRQDYLDAQTVMNAGAATLSQATARYGASLDAFAHDKAHQGTVGDQSAAALIATYQDLAHSSADGALAALSWVMSKYEPSRQPGGKGNAKDVAYASYAVQLGQIQQDAGQTLTERLMEQLKSGIDHRQKPTIVVAQTLESFQNYFVKPLKAISGFAGFSEIGDLVNRINLHIKLDSAVNHDGDFEEVLKIYNELQKEADAAAAVPDPLLRRGGRVLLDVLGVYAVGAEAALGGLKGGPGGAALGALATGTDLPEAMSKGQDLARMLLKIQSGQADKTELAAARRLAQDVFIGKWNVWEKFLPGVGLVASLVQFKQDWTTAQQYKPTDPQFYVAAFQLTGDFFATLGSAAELLPPPFNFMGAILTGIGSAISLACGAILGIIGFKKEEKDPITEDKTEILADMAHGDSKHGERPDVALTDQVRAALLSDNAGSNLRFFDHYGVDPDEVKRIIALWSFLATDFSALEHLYLAYRTLTGKFLLDLDFARFIRASAVGRNNKQFQEFCSRTLTQSWAIGGLEWQFCGLYMWGKLPQQEQPLLPRSAFRAWTDPPKAWPNPYG